MANVTMREMLQAGLHFGHQTRRWNPKMKPYIYGPRNGIYIVNLDKTMQLLKQTLGYVTNQVAHGNKILFVGTKRQAQDIISEEARRCGMYFVNFRWLGGMLTNFKTIKNSIERLKKIESMQADGSINRFPKKEILKMEKERVKLDRNLGGIKDMRTPPDLIFVIDPKKEELVVNEANKLSIPVIAITDTNCDPNNIDFVIPGNDDAIRSIRLITSLIADAALEGKARNNDKSENYEEEMTAKADDKGGGKSSVKNAEESTDSKSA